MTHRKINTQNPYSCCFIQKICELYDDHYDDRIEDSKPPSAGKKDGISEIRQPGNDWQPGMTAGHKSLSVFQRELAKEGIRLSTSKIRKILISGGVWTTERSREVQALFSSLTSGPVPLKPDEAVNTISKKLGVSKVTVTVNLPYFNGVNCLEQKSKNAVRCARYRQKQQDNLPSVSLLRRLKAASPSEQEDLLWKLLHDHQNGKFITSGRGAVPGKPFTYSIRGGEMFVSLKEKSITKATVMMAFRKALAIQTSEGFVQGPKKLGTFGASYLYAIFIHLGIIRSAAEK